MQSLLPTNVIVLEGSVRPYKARLVRKPMKIALRKKPSAKRRIKPKGISKLMKEADAVCSRWVRLSNADQEGFVICYTCGHKAHYKKMHAGHYLSRFYKVTRWTPMNIKPQCPMCNLWKRGDAPTFRENLVKDYGEKSVVAMEDMRKQTIKLTREYLQSIIDFYNQKLESLTS